MQIVPLQDK
uniref:Uncharacterized protein n=1 Tax=Arundo donax TaxID=35708 RepID=A0A0A8YDN8_ARUDO